MIMFRCEECGRVDFKRGIFKGRKVWECCQCHMCYDANFLEDSSDSSDSSENAFEEYQFYKIITKV